MAFRHQQRKDGLFPGVLSCPKDEGTMPIFRDRVGLGAYILFSPKQLLVLWVQEKGRVPWMGHKSFQRNLSDVVDGCTLENHFFFSEKGLAAQAVRETFWFASFRFAPARRVRSYSYTCREQQSKRLHSSVTRFIHSSLALKATESQCKPTI